MEAGGYRRTVHSSMEAAARRDPRRHSPSVTTQKPSTSPHCHLVVRGGTDCNTSWLKMTLNAIAEELAEEQPGSNLVIAKLADLLFISLSARIWLRTFTIPSAGCAASWTLLWACHLLHARCTGTPLDIQALAEEAGCSSRLRAALVGPGALSYLTAWLCTSPPVCCSMEPATLEPWPAEWATDQKQPSQSHSRRWDLTAISPYDASC